MKYEHRHIDGRDPVRRCTVTSKHVVCKNASMLGFTSGYIAKPGNYIVFTTGEDACHVGRVLGRVDAPPDGTVPEVKNHIAVLMLAKNMRHAHIMFADPDTVLEIYERPPRKLVMWLLQDRLPSVTEIFRLNRNGSMSESHIDRPMEG